MHRTNTFISVFGCRRFLGVAAVRYEHTYRHIHGTAKSKRSERVTKKGGKGEVVVEHGGLGEREEVRKI